MLGRLRARLGWQPPPPLRGADRRTMRLVMLRCNRCGQSNCRPGLGNLHKDAMLDVDGFEQLGSGSKHLGPAQKEISRRIESEVEPREDARLQLRVEVHERIAADQQVEA